MTQIKQISLMNDCKIAYLKKMGVTTQRNEIIKKMLEDEACFFKIEKEDSYIILKDVGVSDQKINSVYSKLVSADNFFDLIEAGKINENEKGLKIKYNRYNPNELFKKTEIESKLENKSIIGKKQEKSIFSKIIDKFKRIFKK